MQEAHFREYIRRFNEGDHTTFDDYLAPDVHVRNGTLEFDGIDGMKHHYQQLIWPDFSEQLDVPAYVTDGKRIAIKMLTHFVALHDNPETLFGPVKKGETFDFDGIIMYQLNADGKFSDIQVAYHSFIHTDLNGVKTNMGIAH